MHQYYLGEIRIFGFGTAPDGWLSCNGQILKINDYQNLYGLLGTTFGGNGTTTFALPNLMGRAIEGVGSGHSRGSSRGSERIALDVTNMPKHSHELWGCNTKGNKNSPIDCYFGIANELQSEINMYHNSLDSVKLSPESIENVGRSQAHDNMQPYLALNFCIATTGDVPKRASSVKDEGGDDVSA
ncbi:MAG: hypothetical protein PWP51_2349 [Clostridiales bacterium]|nr:hypothetical protein [Clostridiales bacterium]